MTAPTIHLFEDIFTYVDAVTAKYFTDGAAAVAGSMQSTVYSLLMLYVVLWGWAMLRGMINEPVMDGLSRVLKATFIVAFATNATLYAGDIATFLYEWPPAFAGILMGGVVTNTTQLIDHIASSGLELASQAWQSASLANLGGYLIALVIFAMTLVITAITAAIIISAKFGLAILLAIGPVFILMLLFDSTRQFFDKWLGVVVTSGFTIVLVSMAATMIFKFYGAAFDAASANAAASGGVVTLGDIAAPTVAGIISAFFILGIPGLASSLGGGIGGASAGAVGWAYDKIRGAVPSQRRQVSSKNSNSEGRFSRGQAEGGKIAKGSGGGNPMAMYRKITGRRARAA